MDIRRHMNKKLTITQEKALHDFLLTEITTNRPGFTTLVAIANRFINDQQYEVGPISKKWVHAFVHKNGLSKAYFKDKEF